MLPRPCDRPDKDEARYQSLGTTRGVGLDDRCTTPADLPDPLSVSLSRAREWPRHHPQGCRMLPVPDHEGPFVLRTYFGDQSAWEALQSAVHGADPDGGSGYVGFVDDLAYRDLTAEQFAELMPQGDNDPTFLLLADERAVMDKEYPILVLDLYEEGRGRSRPRGIASSWRVGWNAMNAKDAERARLCGGCACHSRARCGGQPRSTRVADGRTRARWLSQQSRRSKGHLPILVGGL
ncbi:DUF6924 domain-containing protein [Streptomyces sp. NPDC096152]|uniref:DUF6924 domain-containing protein n=1 Tax=Streptomyces sp. NPDC096152 TaxID=3366078 RepID=UPI0037FAE469